MKVSERIRFDSDETRLDYYLFSALNPETGKGEIFCSVDIKYKKDELARISNWDVDKAYLTREELKTHLKSWNCPQPVPELGYVPGE